MSAISHYGLVTPFRPSLKVAYFDRLRTWCGVCRHPKPDDIDDVGLNQTQHKSVYLKLYPFHLLP